MRLLSIQPTPEGCRIDTTKLVDYPAGTVVGCDEHSPEHRWEVELYNLGPRIRVELRLWPPGVPLVEETEG